MPYLPGNLPPIPAPIPPTASINATPSDGSTNAGQYAVETVSLAGGANNQLLSIGPGQFFCVVNGSAGSTGSVTFDQSTTSIPVYPGLAINVQFTQAFFTAAAQANMSMTFLSSPRPDFVRM